MLHSAPLRLTPNPHAKTLGIATIGDTDRHETFRVVSTVWDSNGTLFVTIENLSEQIKESQDLTSTDLERARRLARRCLMYPEKTRSSRLIRHKLADARLQMLFAVSRNSAY